MAVDITFRRVKGTRLTHGEVDDNFENLKSHADANTLPTKSANAIMSVSEDGTAWEAKSPSLIRSIVRAGQVISVADQQGASIYERTALALGEAEAEAGTKIIGERGDCVIPSGASDYLKVPSHTELFCNGTVFKSEQAFQSIVGTMNADNVDIHDMVIDAGGTTVSPSLNSLGAFQNLGGRNIRLFRPEVKNWANYGIHGRSTLLRPIDGFHIFGARVIAPAAGCDFGIFVQSANGTPRGRDVVIEGADCWGTDPFNPAVFNADGAGDWTSTNEFTADFYTLHGMMDSVIRNCALRFGGSACVTISRGCENVSLENVIGRHLHEPWVNVGSSYIRFHITVRTGWVVGGEVTSDATPSISAEIAMIVADPSGPGAWVFFVSVTGNTLKASDTVFCNGLFPTSITPSPSDSPFDPGRSIIFSAYNVEILGGVAEDCCITSDADAAVNGYHAQGENSITDVTVGDPNHYKNKPNNLVLNTHGVFHICSGNTVNGRAVNPNMVTLSGTSARWAVENYGTGVAAQALGVNSTTGQILRPVGLVDARAKATRIHVAGRTNFVVGDTVTNGTASAPINFILNDWISTGAWLFLETVTGGTFAEGDGVSTGIASSTINEAPTRIHVDDTQNFLVAANMTDGTLTALIVAITDVEPPHPTTGKTAGWIWFENAAGDTFSVNSIVTSGAGSAEVDAAPFEVLNNGVAVTTFATGGYGFAFLRPMESTNYAVRVNPTTSQLIGREVTKTLYGFTIELRNASTNATTAGAFSLEVMA